MESLTAINKPRIRQAFQKALSDYDRHALIQQKMTINLIAHLQDYLPDMPLENVLELGCGSGMLSALLQKQISANYWLFNDLCDVRSRLAEKLPQSFDFYCGDAENFPFQRQFDLIASASVVQWFSPTRRFYRPLQNRLENKRIIGGCDLWQRQFKRSPPNHKYRLKLPDFIPMAGLVSQRF